MGGAGERCGQSRDPCRRSPRSSCGLGEEDAVGEVGAGQYRRPGNPPRAGRPIAGRRAKIGPDEVGAPEAGAPQVGAPQALAHQVGSAAFHLPPRRRARAPVAGAQQQAVVRRAAPPTSSFLSASGGGRSAPRRRPASGGARLGGGSRAAQRFGTIQASSWSCRIMPNAANIRVAMFGRPPPVPTLEGHLRNLSGPRRSSRRPCSHESRARQRSVNAASEVRSQMHAWLPGSFVNCKVRRGRKRGRDTAQPETASQSGRYRSRWRSSLSGGAIRRPG